MTGCFSVSKKSVLRRCASRSALLVSTDESSTSAVTDDRVEGGADVERGLEAVEAAPDVREAEVADDEEDARSGSCRGSTGRGPAGGWW